MPPRRQSRSRRNYLSTSALSICDLPKQCTSEANNPITTAPLENNYADELQQTAQGTRGSHARLPETYQENEHYQQQHPPGMNEITPPFLHVDIPHPSDNSQSADKPASPVPSNDGSAETSEKQDIVMIRTIKQGMRYLVPWNRLLALLSLHGSVRFNQRTYKLMAEAIQTASDRRIRLPTAKTVRNKQHEYFIGTCLPENGLHHLRTMEHPCTLRLNQASVRAVDGSYRHPRECIRLVLPSAWARLDMQLHNVFSDIITGDHHTNENLLSIERTAAIRNRRILTGTASTFWASHDGEMTAARPGDSVSFLSTDHLGNFNPIKGWPCARSSTQVSHQSTYLVQGKVGEQWCVGKNGFRSLHTTAIVSADLHPQERKVYKCLAVSFSPVLSTNETFRNKSTEVRQGIRKTSSAISSSNRVPSHDANAHSTLIVYPSDICTFIRPLDKPDSHHIVCLFITSIVSTVTGGISERLVWVDLENEKNRQQYRPGMSLYCETSLTCKEVPTIIDFQVGPISSHPSNDIVDEHLDHAPAGFLEDGSRYAIYRFIFFADEFQEKKSLKNVRSTCGIYLLPVGVSQHTRGSLGGVRILTLVPHDQDPNDALHIIIDDIVKGCVEGIKSTDVFGRDITIFLDVVGFFGDFVKMASVSDNMGHSASSFCTHCSIRKNINPTSSRYIFSTSIHSHRLGFMRCDERLDIIRQLDVPENVRKSVGITTSSAEESMKYPMVALSAKLVKRKMEIPNTSKGKKVVSGFFDSSLSTAVAPDHLLTGLIVTLLHTAFSKVPTASERMRLQHQILCAATDNGLSTNGKFLYNETSTFKGIKNNMSMSTLFTVLLMSTPFLEKLSAGNGDHNNAFNLPILLQRFIATLFFWPDERLDSEQDVSFLRGDSFKGYLTSLHRLATEYSSAVIKYINKYTRERNAPDRPNSHRLLELVVHTLPLFGHGRMVSELIMEVVHQTFKSWLDTNTSPDAHITAVDIGLCRHWAFNVYTNYMVYKNGNDDDKILAQRSLFRLFFGESVQHAQQSSDDKVKKELEKFCETIDETMRQPVLNMLGGSVPYNFLRSCYVWKVREVVKLSDVASTVLTRTWEIISSQFNEPISSTKTECIFFHKADLVSQDQFASSIRTYPHRTIRRGCAVQFFIGSVHKSDTYISCMHDPAGTRMTVAVRRIFQYRGRNFITASRLVSITSRLWKVQEGHLCVVELLENVHRVAVVHNCDERCTVRQSRLHHSASVLSGGLFHIIGRADGYPPHVG